MKKIDKEFDEFKAKVLILIPKESDVIKDKDDIIASLIDEIYCDIGDSENSYCVPKETCDISYIETIRILRKHSYIKKDEFIDIPCKVCRIFNVYEEKRKEKYRECGIEHLYNIETAFDIYDMLNGNKDWK